MADAAEALPGAETLAGLRDRHLDLLEQWGIERAEALAPQAEALRAAAQAIGGWLDAPDERDRAQGIIDYWTAALTGLQGRPFPQMLRLAPFDRELPAAEVARAEEILAPYAGTPLEAWAEEMLLCLVRPGPHGTLICRSLVERAELIAAGGEVGEGADAARKAEFLDSLIATGILRASDDPSGGEPRYAFAHGSTARAWPRLRKLVDQSRKMHANINRLRATAQLWKQSGDAGFLLFGDALDEAGKYLGQDDTLNAFIAASRRAAERRRKQWLIVSLALLLAIVGATAVAFKVGNLFGAEEGFGKGEKSGFIQGARTGFDTAVLKQEEVVQRDSPPPEAPASLDEGAHRLAGWIWAGSERQPLLFDLEGSRPVAPASLALNGRYRAGTNLWLRAGPPDSQGISAERVSVVPRRGIVIVRAAPRSVRRASGEQYWVRVGVVPAVYMQFVNAEPDQIRRLSGVIAAAGYEVPPAEERPEASNHREVRYFRPEHREIAAFLASQLAGRVSAADGSPISVRCVQLKAGFEAVNLEVWLDFEGLRLSPPRRRLTVPECV